MLSFRGCVAGEILVNNQCQECANGYLLQYDPAQLSCAPCPANADHCAGSEIFVAPGYWRVGPTATSIRPCPYGTAACKGGSFGPLTRTSGPSGRRALAGVSAAATYVSTSPLCHDGYMGPLCATCAPGRWFNFGTNACEVCVGGGGGSLAPLIIVPLVLLGLALTVILRGVVVGHRHALALEAAGGQDGEDGRRAAAGASGRPDEVPALVGGSGKGGAARRRSSVVRAIDYLMRRRNTSVAEPDYASDDEGSDGGRGARSAAGGSERRRSVAGLVAPEGLRTVLGMVRAVVAAVSRRLQRHSLMAKTKIIVTCYQVRLWPAWKCCPWSCRP